MSDTAAPCTVPQSAGRSGNDTIVLGQKEVSECSDKCCPSCKHVLHNAREFSDDIGFIVTCNSKTIVAVYLLCIFLLCSGSTLSPALFKQS
eukprot:328127-Pelagomonas_calceolata.AAC.2